jgi:hypothetical protein
MFVNNTGLILALLTYFSSYWMVIITAFTGLFLIVNKAKIGFWISGISWLGYLLLSYITTISQALLPVDLNNVFGQNFENASKVATNFTNQIYLLLFFLAFVLAGFKIYKFVLKSKLKLKDLRKNSEFWYAICGLFLSVSSFQIVSTIINLI